MNKLKSFLGNTMAFLYFIFVMLWILLLLAFVPFGLFMDIQIIRESGFSTTNIGMTFIAILGLFIGISLIVPVFRKMYYKLPWLLSYVKIFYCNLVIMSIATSILNYGYEVQDSKRHMIFFILMIAQIVICRIGMCI